MTRPTWWSWWLQQSTTSGMMCLGGLGVIGGPLGGLLEVIVGRSWESLKAQVVGGLLRHRKKSGREGQLDFL